MGHAPLQKHLDFADIQRSFDRKVPPLGQTYAGVRDAVSEEEKMKIE
jgi:hypothetical protein